MGAGITLKVIEGILNGQEFHYAQRISCTIGRAKDCDIRLVTEEQEHFISRYHCQLEIDPPAIRVRDLQSKNGTYVNGRKIGEGAVSLSNGDRLQVGKTIFRIEIDDPDLQEPATRLLIEAAEPMTHLTLENPTSSIRLVPQAREDVPPEPPLPAAKRPLETVSPVSLAPSFSVTYFGLRRKPFQGTGLDFLRTHPDYETCYTNLLDTIRKTVKLIVLLGETGTGKSLLLGNLVHDPTVGLNCVSCKAPASYEDLLGLICKSLNLTVVGTERAHKFRALLEYTQSPAHQTIVLTIDDADRLEDSTIRNLLSLPRLGLVGSIVLAGSPPLRDKLVGLSGEADNPNAAVDNRMLSKAAYIELKPLNGIQTAVFIQQQLYVAGNSNPALFSKAVIGHIASLSRGIPGLINALCDRALWAAESASQKIVSIELVNMAASQLNLPDSELRLVTRPSARPSVNPAARAHTEPAEPPAIQPDDQADQKPGLSRSLLLLIVLAALGLLGGIGIFWLF